MSMPSAYPIGRLDGNAGSVMDVDNANINNNAKIQIGTSNGLNHQKWTATPAGDGFFKFTAVHSGKLADVNGGSTADGATIIQWQSHGGDNQQWSFALAP